MKNLCFIALGETRELRPYNSSYFDDLKKYLDIVSDELQNVINE